MFSTRSVLLYGGAALAGLVELSIAWLLLHPNVPANYRAYYIDQTTTCLDQPSPGRYQFGSWVSFRSGSEAFSKPLRVCGWEGPAGDGLHAIGESSRLRFALPPQLAEAYLSIELTAVGASPASGQPVDLVVDGTVLRRVVAPRGSERTFVVPLPAAALSGHATLDLELRYPEAITMFGGDSATRKRSIKLTGAGIFSNSLGVPSPTATSHWLG